jgi:acyl-CoA thioester hydrolase
MAEHRFLYTDRVQFSGSDMAGIVHSSNFFRFMKRAEHAFFRSINLSIWENPDQILDEERIG